MKLSKAKEIAAMFAELEDDFPSKSFEWLLNMTAERMGVDYSDVIDALRIIHDQAGAKEPKA